MKKKQIAKLAVTLGLVGAVGVGGTLAILSQKSNVVTNTFAAGDGIDADTDITLFETADPEGKLGEDGVRDTYRDNVSAGKNIDIDGRAYTDLEPNMSVQKDPAVEIAKGTADCYLFVKVENVKNFEDTIKDVAIDGVFDEEGNTTRHWLKLDGTDDIYYYVESNEALKGQVINTDEENFVSEPLFNEISFGMNADLYTTDPLPQITVKAFVVQATANGNWDEAVTLAKNPANWTTPAQP